MMDGTGVCVPFGGVGRSALLGLVGTPIFASQLVIVPLNQIRGEDTKAALAIMGNSVYCTGLGLIAIADVPVSLAGDLLTLPLAYARHQQQPWAMWPCRDIVSYWVWAPFAQGDANEAGPKVGSQPGPVQEDGKYQTGATP
jgi:hypothetical protein